MKHFLVLRPNEVTSCDRQPAGLAAPVRLLLPVVMTTAGTPALIIPATLTVLPSCARVCVCARACPCAQADRSAGRLTGSMMELQTLQEALKVEIQIHQVGVLLSGPLGQWVSRDGRSVGGGGGGVGALTFSCFTFWVWLTSVWSFTGFLAACPFKV